MEQIIRGLKSVRPIAEAEPPQAMGFYAFFVVSANCFEDTALRDIKQGDCIYIGIAKDESLYDRVINCHLKDSGKSTFRRSLGAVLRNKLCLHPIIRGITVCKSNITNYSFGSESEKRITNFICKHLGVSFYPYISKENNIEEIEKQLIKEFGFPVFNIEYSGTQNPYKKVIKELRKECRDIVKIKGS